MKIIYAIIFAAALSTSLQAQILDDQQEEDEQRERIQNRIESQKIAFITQKLNLTTAEAQNFWPIYNEFQVQMKDFRNQYKFELENRDLSEADANIFLNELLDREQEELDLKKGYFQKLKSAVSAQKVAKLYIIEKKFREEILANIKSRMGKKKRKLRN
jgi:hypothetical protein